MSIILKKETAPDAPATNKVNIYVDSADGKMKAKDEAGDEIVVASEGLVEWIETTLQWNIDNIDDTLANYSTGIQLNDLTMSPVWAYHNVQSAVFIKIGSFNIPVTWIYRVYYWYGTNSSSNGIFAQVYKNWTAYWTEKSYQANTTIQYFSEDLSFTAWDTCEIWAKTNNPVDPYNWIIRDFQLRGTMYLYDNTNVISITE